MIKKLILAGIVVVTGNLYADDAPGDYLRIGNDNIYYEVVGTGEPLLLISGGSGMDMRQWDRVTPDLSQTYRVIRVDPRGIGKSDNPSTPYSDAADIDALLAHLGLNTIGLMGLSSGGGVALEFAVRYPHRLRSLVVAAPFIPGFDFSSEMLERLTRFNTAVENGRDAYLDVILADPHFIPAPLARHIRDDARKNMGFNFDKGADFDGSLPIPMSPPLIERLTEVSTRTLLLAGELDHPEVLRRNRFLLGAIDSASADIVANAGHNAPLENPAGYLAAIQGFLADTMHD